MSDMVNNIKVTSVIVTTCNRPFFKNIGRKPYKCLYLTLKTNTNVQGYGVICIEATRTNLVQITKTLCEGLLINAYILNDFSNFCRRFKKIANIEYAYSEIEIEIAISVIINALWDVWAKVEKKSLFNLLIDLSPEKLASLIDFSLISDVITKEEAIYVLQQSQNNKKERIEILNDRGYPAYATIHESDRDVVLFEISKASEKNFNVFRINFEVNYTQEGNKTLEKIRNAIGPAAGLILDVNSLWKIEDAVADLKLLSQFNFLWVESPLCGFELENYVEISRQRQPSQWRIGNSQICSNIDTCKKFLKADAIQYCEIDSLFHGTINDILSIYLMAFKLNVKVSVRANHSGFCEMLQHLQMWDYVALSATMEDRFIECPIIPSDHFTNPVVIQNGYYKIPTAHGCSTQMIGDKQSVVIPTTNSKEKKSNLLFKTSKITF